MGGASAGGPPGGPSGPDRRRSIRLNRAAAKSLSRLSSRAQAQISERIRDLSTNATPHDSRPLKGFAGWLRIDVGEYRVIYRIEGEEVFVAILGPRNDDRVHREFTRWAKGK